MQSVQPTHLGRILCIAIVVSGAILTEPHTVTADDSKLVIITDHQAFSVTFGKRFELACLDKDTLQNATKQKQKAPDFPIDLPNKLITSAAGAPWMNDGIALALTIKAQKEYAYYWATLNLHADPAYWAISRIDMSSSLDRPPYIPTYIRNDGGDWLRIQWERRLPLSNNEGFRTESLLYENHCASSSLDGSGSFYKILVGEKIGHRITDD